MSPGKTSRKQRKKNVYAAVLKLFKPKIVKPKKGKKAYSRKKFGKPVAENQ